MRADRLVSILLWLQVHGKTSTEELARRLEVSPRTILRDMDALTTAGIPVVAQRGRIGGSSLPAEYRLGSKWLSTAEVRALAVLTPAHILADLGIAGTADAAWLKLMAALPPVHRDEATFVQERVHVDTSTWRPRQESTAWLPELKDALFADRKVCIAYRRSNGDSVVRTVAPLGLIAKGHAWYLAGDVDGQVRTYRVSRMQSVEVLPEPFERPVDFDLREFWEASKVSLEQGLPRYPVTLRVQEQTAATLPGGLRWARLECVDPAGSDGWCRVSILFESRDEALSSILGFGDRLEVLSPDDLREAVIDATRAMLALYAGSPGTSSAPFADPEDDTAALVGEHASLEPGHEVPMSNVLPSLFGATADVRPTERIS